VPAVKAVFAHRTPMATADLDPELDESPDRALAITEAKSRRSAVTPQITIRVGNIDCDGYNGLVEEA